MLRVEAGVSPPHPELTFELAVVELVMLLESPEVYLQTSPDYRVSGCSSQWYIGPREGPSRSVMGVSGTARCVQWTHKTRGRNSCEYSGQSA